MRPDQCANRPRNTKKALAAAVGLVVVTALAALLAVLGAFGLLPIDEAARGYLWRSCFVLMGMLYVCFPDVACSWHLRSQAIRPERDDAVRPSRSSIRNMRILGAFLLLLPTVLMPVSSWLVRLFLE